MAAVVVVVVLVVVVSVAERSATRFERRALSPASCSGEARFTVFPFPRCISRDCNANVEQRILRFSHAGMWEPDALSRSA